MAFEGDPGSMSNTLFPIFPRQAGVKENGINGDVPFMASSGVQLQEDSRFYVPWSVNTRNEPNEMNCVQSHIQNRPPSDVTDDGEKELQSLVSNILNEAESQNSFYSDGSLSQHINNIWSPKMQRDEACFQIKPTNFNTNHAPHESVGKANREAEELCQAISNGLHTNQHLLSHLPIEARDIFSAQHGLHKPPPGLPLPTNTYMTPLPKDNYENIQVSKERQHGKHPRKGFLELSQAFRPQCEKNGADLFYEDRHNQGMDQLASSKHYTSQELNQLINSFQSFAAGEDDGYKFQNMSMQPEDNLADKWRNPSTFRGAQGNHMVQPQKQMNMDFGSAAGNQNCVPKEQLFKRDSRQELPIFNFQTAEYSPNAKLSMGHFDSMLQQRENTSHPLSLRRLSMSELQQNPLRFKSHLQTENLFYDLPASARPQRLNQEDVMIRFANKQQFTPHAVNDPRMLPSQFQNLPFLLPASLSYRGGIQNVDMMDLSFSERSGVCPGFNNMISRGAITYQGMSPVPMNKGEPSVQLVLYLNECFEQWRWLERDRKRIEIALSKTFLDQQATALPNASLPKTPRNPPKVDHLIANLSLEQTRVSSLLDKMECLSGVPINPSIRTTLTNHHMAIVVTSARSRDEVINHQRHRAPVLENKGTVLLVEALVELAVATRQLRSAMWCALQMMLPKIALRPEPPAIVEKPEGPGSE